MTAGAAIETCPNPIFIVGAPRSGTTGLAKALSRHSELSATEESQVLWDLFGQGQLLKNYKRRGQFGGSWLVKHDVSEAEFLAFVGLGLNALFTSVSKGKRWIDHTPRYTLMINQIAGLFPECQVIHILRDGRSVVHSMQNYADRFKIEATAPWQRGFREACQVWRNFVETATTFSKDHPGQCLEVRYEELVGESEASFERIFEFLGIEPAPESARTFSSGPVNSSFRKKSGEGGYGGNHEAVWEAWSSRQRKTFLKEAGPLMKSLGLLDDSVPA